MFTFRYHKIGSFVTVALAATFGAVGVAQIADAIPITVLNPNFTEPALNPTTYASIMVAVSLSPGNDSQYITDWGTDIGNTLSGAYNAEGVTQFASPPSPPSPALSWATINGSGDYIFQDVGALTANTDYTLTVTVAPATGGYGKGFPAEIALVNTASDPDTTTQNDVGTPLTSHSLLALSKTTVLTTSYTSGGSVNGDLTIQLGIPGPLTTTGEQANFSGVGLTATAVPAPATAGLLAIGGTVGLLLVRRRSV